MARRRIPGPAGADVLQRTTEGQQYISTPLENNIRMVQVLNLINLA